MEPPNAVYLASFYSNLKNALLNLPNLQNLRLLVSDPHLTRTLFCSATGTFRFPSLRHFETYLPLTSPLLRFIERHPKLTYLEVSQYENFSLDENLTKCSDCSRIPRKPALLNLRHYVGNSVYLPLLASISPLPLRSAHLTWSAVHECRASITSLAQASSNTLNVLTCRRRGWNVDLIEYVASQLSDVYMLHVINVLVMDAALSEDFQHGIARHLARFRRLQRLKITHEMGWRPSAVRFDLDREFAVVTEWGAACPSLVIITLPHSEPHIEWHRVADNIWVPSDVSPGETARRWLRDSVRGRGYPRTLKSFKQVEGHLSHSLCSSPVNERFS